MATAPRMMFGVHIDSHAGIQNPFVSASAVDMMT